MLERLGHLGLASQRPGDLLKIQSGVGQFDHQEAYELLDILAHPQT